MSNNSGFEFSPIYNDFPAGDTTQAGHSNGVFPPDTINRGLPDPYQSSGLVYDRGQTQMTRDHQASGSQGPRPHTSATPMGTRQVAAQMPRSSEAKPLLLRQFEEQSRAIRNVQLAQQDIVDKVEQRLTNLTQILFNYTNNFNYNVQKLFDAQARVDAFLAQLPSRHERIEKFLEIIDAQVEQSQEDGNLVTNS